MANQSLPDLNNNSSPTIANLTYTARDNGSGWFTDAKITLGTTKSFCSTSSVVEKTSSYTITASDCDGRWISNFGSSGNITFTLPLAQDGYEIGFILEEYLKWIELKPDSGDSIFPIGTDGVSVYGSVQGSTVYLRSVQDGWQIVSSYGMWSLTGSSSSSSLSSSSYSSSSSSSSSLSSSSSSLSSSSSSLSSSSCSLSSSSSSLSSSSLSSSSPSSSSSCSSSSCSSSSSSCSSSSSSSSSCSSCSCSSSSSSTDAQILGDFAHLMAFWNVDEVSGTRYDDKNENDMQQSSSSSCSSWVSSSSSSSSSSRSSSSSSLSSSSLSSSSLSSSSSSSKSSSSNCSSSCSSSSSSMDNQNLGDFSHLTAFWNMDEVDLVRHDDKNSNDFSSSSSSSSSSS